MHRLIAALLMIAFLLATLTVAAQEMEETMSCMIWPDQRGSPP